MLRHRLFSAWQLRLLMDSGSIKLMEYGRGMDMDYGKLMEKINMLEFHQKLLLKMVTGSKEHFYRLIIERGLTQQEVASILEACEKMSMHLEEQKAEGFMYFHPLYKKFSTVVQPKLQPEEVIKACESQGLFLPLMTELRKYIEN